MVSDLSQTWSNRDLPYVTQKCAFIMTFSTDYFIIVSIVIVYQRLTVKIF